MENECVNIKIGYIKLNTSYIPTFLRKEKATDLSNLKDIYIKSKIPISIRIGGVTYILESGEHFFPSALHTYHNFDILPKVASCSEDLEECEVYSCICDEEYFSAVRLMILYDTMVKSIHSKDENDLKTALPSRAEGGDLSSFIFRCGMGGLTTAEDIYEKNIEKNNIVSAFKNSYKWGKFFDHYFYKDPAKNTYSQYIDTNIEQIQHDYEVTQYLIDWKEEQTFYYESNRRDDASPPTCLRITYCGINYQKLKDVLQTKYNIKLEKPRTPNKIRKTETYHSIQSLIVERNNKIKKYEDMGIFEFIILEEFPYNIDFYNKLKNEWDDIEIDIEELVPVERKTDTCINNCTIQ